MYSYDDSGRRRTLHRVPRARSLTLSGIAAAALTVLDRSGLDGLTMRAVATEMQVGTMSLYRYVESREQVEELAVDLVLAGVDVDAPEGASWAEQVTVLASRVREVVAAHPGVAPLLLARRHSSPASQAWGEAVLRALADGGFEGADRVVAFRTLLAYVFGAVQVEHHSPVSGSGTAALAELPADRFPMLTATAASALRMRPEDEFRLGLAVVLRGLGDGGAPPPGGGGGIRRRVEAATPPES